MPRLYATAADHINNHPYLVLANSSYTPVFPQIYLFGEIEPIYNNPEPAHPVRTMLSINFLIDMFTTGQQFAVVNDMDNIRIFHSIDAYLIEIRELVFVSTEIKNYAEKVLRFRVEVYKNFVRTLNRHPEWKEAYRNGSDDLFTLFDLFAAPDTNSSAKWKNVIERLEAPPFQLDPKLDKTDAQVTQNSSPLAVPYFYR